MKKILIYIIFMLSIITLAGCDFVSEENQKESKQKTLVYMTNQYQGYRRLALLAANSFPDGVMTEISETELTYEADNVFLEVTTVGEWESLFKVYVENEFCYEFLCAERNVSLIAETGMDAMYVDITMDGNKDVVIVIEPVRGTMTGPCLAYAYDVVNDEKIGLFQENGSLTDAQLDELALFLDEEFYEVFPEFTDISQLKQYGKLYVDEFGQMYYNTYISGKESLESIGEMLIFLNWDKENGSIYISDIMYMPMYVLE